MYTFYLIPSGFDFSGIVFIWLTREVLDYAEYTFEGLLFLDQDIPTSSRYRLSLAYTLPQLDILI